MENSEYQEGFKSELLSLYLGKYKPRFTLQKVANMNSVAYFTGPYPKLILTYDATPRQKAISVALFECIKINADDPWYGIFDDYQIEVVSVSIEDPLGMEKIEQAITRSFLAGTNGY